MMFFSNRVDTWIEEKFADVQPTGSPTLARLASRVVLGFAIVVFGTAISASVLSKAYAMAGISGVSLLAFVFFYWIAKKVVRVIYGSSTKFEHGL
jgi:hypothetical protein